MKKRIAVIPGDGIGRDVTAEAVKVLSAVADAGGHQFNYTMFDWGADRYLAEGVGLPKGALTELKKSQDAILLGALGDPRIPDMAHGKEILFGLRFGLDLYANVRPVTLLDPALTPLRDRGVDDINFVIYRENTEGNYVGMGGNFKKGTEDEVAIQEDINTYKGVERIIRYAFEQARRTGRKKMTMSDKSNALSYGHGLWQRVFAEVAPKYDDIESSHMYVDNMAFQMVRDPSQFDAIVTCNLFGDILNDLGAGLVGGLGIAPSANINPEGLSLFEPVHGSAPDQAGKGTANPVATILTAAMMLDHLGLATEAEWMQSTVRASMTEGKTTRDLGGELSTVAAGDWIADHITANYPLKS